MGDEAGGHLGVADDIASRQRLAPPQRQQDVAGRAADRAVALRVLARNGETLVTLASPSTPPARRRNAGGPIRRPAPRPRRHPPVKCVRNSSMPSLASVGSIGLTMPAASRRVPQVHRGLLRHPTNHESGRLVARPRPHRRRRIRLASVVCSRSVTAAPVHRRQDPRRRARAVRS